MDCLPVELKLKILSHIDEKGLVRLFTLNKEYYHLCTDDQLWRQFTCQQFGRNVEVVDTWFGTYKIYNKFKRPYIVIYQCNNRWNVVSTHSSRNEALCSVSTHYINLTATCKSPIENLNEELDIDTLKRFPQNLIDDMKDGKLHQHPLKQEFVDYVTNLLLKKVENYDSDMRIVISPYERYQILFHEIDFDIKDKLICSSISNT